MEFDGKGDLWLALREGNQIWRLGLKEGTVHHVAGSGKQGPAGDGGPAKDAELTGPKGLALGELKLFFGRFALNVMLNYMNNDEFPIQNGEFCR